MTLRITYADTTKSSVEITALTQGQTDENEGQDITHREGEQGGLFEVQVPNDERLKRRIKCKLLLLKSKRWPRSDRTGLCQNDSRCDSS